MEELLEICKGTREKNPLVHFITNYVTVNDCANITLAAGGAPIMADDIREVEGMVELCSSLVINIGTLNERTEEAMIAAGRLANKLHKPILLDPAGVGASQLRNDTVSTLIRELDFSVIKGNISEMKYITGGISSTRGVDAKVNELVSEENLETNISFARELSLLTGAIIVITGPIDIVSSSREAYAIRNGHPIMARVTGTGCMSGAVIGSYSGAYPDQVMKASVAAVAAMGICGEIAFDRLEKAEGGFGSYRSYLIDSMSMLTSDVFRKKAKVELMT